MDFQGFGKIARYSLECIVTEKIDGTNAQIFIGDDGKFLVGSRTRWITPEQDNHGFARWAYAHKDELMALGRGRHFGEWWGKGVNRGYGLPDKRLSLFNAVRWCLHGTEPMPIPTGEPGVFKTQDVLPACVGLVPVLWRGSMDDLNMKGLIDGLRFHGSYAAPGYMNPEGIVVYHTAGNVSFKKTIEKDEVRKGR